MAIDSEKSKFDLRTLKRYLREGKITQKEWEAHLKNLPDESSKAEPLVMKDEEKRKTASTAHREPTFALATES